ncbi:redoxin domain-containing protein [Paractinoplanes durhamensis]|uniref:Thiol:disulfide interchange protein n=1 Tax=Paractinoplanes durhamensis TaxID=113563 RepID=A0ABQ3YSA9_9ACTN|nr:redoxin domain-containing protein [Actinoplanes durhamensis]GIE00466.1 thiol:disulfide interchange protein [Actinoplanes durhamensis]
MRRLLALLFVAGLTAGCAAPVATTPGAAPITPASLPATDRSPAAQDAAELPAPEDVPRSLQFTGTTLDGAAYNAAALAGKPAILWFWAPWCATCAGEAQSIADLADEYKGQIGILGIAGLGKNSEMHEFVSDLDVDAVPHLDDEAGKIWKRFKITQQSWYVFIDRTGKVVRIGYLDDLQLTEQVKTLVA